MSGELQRYAEIFAFHGFPPIRVTANGKRPIDKDWQTTRDDTPQAAGERFKDHSGNIGVTFGPDFFALDLDVKGGKNGIEEMERISEPFGGLPQTLTQHTAGGGTHLFFRKPRGVVIRNGVDRLGPGIDVRAKGGFVVVEPSTINDKGYRFDDWSALDGEVPEIADAPAHLLAMLAEPAAAAPSATSSGVSAKLSEGGRNDALFRDACAMRRRDFDEEAILAALMVRNRKDCLPPLDDSEVRTIANSASGYVPAVGDYQANGSSVTTGDSDALASLENNIISLDSMSQSDDTPLPHVVSQWIPCDEVTLLAGHGGGGKSYVALLIAVCVTLRLAIGNLPTNGSKVVFFSGEDGGRVIRQRLARICRALNIDPKSLDGKLFLLDASDIDPALHREQRVNIGGRQSIVTETALVIALSELVKKLDAGFVVIDNASDAFDDDEIRRSRVRAFVRSLRSRIARPGRAVLLLAHVNKQSARGGREAGTEDYSGSTAWHNSVRSRLSLIPDGADRLVIEHVKANLGAKAGPVVFEWHDGVPLVSGSYSDEGKQAVDALNKAAEAVRDDADKVALVSIIQDFDRRGETVTTATNGSAPVFKLLKSCGQFPKNTDSERLTRLLRSLESESRIFRRAIRTPDRKWKNVFTCLPEPDSAPNRTDDAKNDGERVAA